MAKKEAAVKSGGETVKLTAGDVAEVKADDLVGKGAEVSAKEKRAGVTHEALIEQAAAQGGKCYITDGPLGKGFVRVPNGAGFVLVSKRAADGRAGRDLEGLRAKIMADLKDAREVVDVFGKLAAEDGYVTFAGEPKSEKTGDEREGAQ